MKIGIVGTGHVGCACAMALVVVMVVTVSLYLRATRQLQGRDVSLM